MRAVKASLKRRFVAPIILAVACAASWIGTHYQAWRYRGGPLADHGLLTRPRYVAQFPEIPIDVPGIYTYTFTRFPASDAGVMLETPGAPSDEAVRKLATQLRLRIEDRDGRVICDGTGAPHAQGKDRIWVQSSAAAIALYHTNCLRLDLRRCVSCRLQIWVGPVDPAAPPLWVVPALHGGGWELPL